MRRVDIMVGRRVGREGMEGREVSILRGEGVVVLVLGTGEVRDWKARNGV